MIVIPAIDIMDGKCVRLSQGDYDQKKIYTQNAIELSAAYCAAGFSNLHLVDLDGAKKGSIVNWHSIKEITHNAKIKVDVGGGVKTETELDRLFSMGVSQVNLGSIAIRDKELFFSWVSKYGPEKIILSADVRAGKVAINGWMEDTRIDLLSLLEEYIERGIRYVTCTDISKDGMMQGPNLDLYADVLKQFPTLNLIASGGVSTVKDLIALAGTGCYGAIVGKALLEGNVTPSELRKLNLLM